MSEEVQKQDESENGNLAKVEKRLTEFDPKIFEGIPKQKKQQIINPTCNYPERKSCLSMNWHSSSSDLCTTDFFLTKGAYLYFKAS